MLSAFVMRLYQARCYLCDWSGEVVDNFKTADIDKKAHIAEKHQKAVAHA